MAEINIGEAAGSGFGLVRRQPLAVFAWGLLPLAAVLLIALLFGGGIVASISTLAQTKGEPAAAQILGLIGGMFGAIMLLLLLLAVVTTMVRGAAYRAELEPNAGGFAYLRLGAQEGWLFASNLVLGLVMFGVQFAMSIPLAIITVIMTVGSLAASGGNGGDAAMGQAMMGSIGVRLLGQLVVAGVSAWLWLRLCLGPVMSFREKQFRLFESWQITKGHVWRMFLSMLLVYLVIFAIEFVLIAVAIGVFVGLIAGSAAAAGSPEAFFRQPPAVWLGVLAPMILVAVAFFTLLSGLFSALLYTPIARMYRQLVPETADPSRVFS